MDISIIIPTFNREPVLKQTLDHMQALLQAYNAEIIVVNDGEPLKGDYANENIQIFKNPKRGVTSARNFGAANAKSEVLFFLDDDMWCNENAMQSIIQFKERNLFADNCFIMNWQYPDDLISSLQQNKIGRYLLHANYHKLEGRLKAPVSMQQEFMKIYSIGSGSFVISKERFKEIGGYDEFFHFQGEDIAISKRINDHKISILLHTPITCFHNQRDRLDIDGKMDRDYRGYYSQFLNGDILQMSFLKRIIFTILLPFKGIFKTIFSILPNNSFWDKLTFRFIGILGSLSLMQAYFDVKNKKS